MILVNKDPSILGIDIGNVITVDRDKAIIFEKQNLKIPEIKGSIERIKELNDYFKGLIYLVSKCRKIDQGKSLCWLSFNNFYERSGVPANHVFFCESRGGKHPICEKLKITHFVDDRLEVLGSLLTVKNKFLFNPNDFEVRRNQQYLNDVIRVDDWNEAKTAIIQTL